jgi:hypothetical protein
VLSVGGGKVRRPKPKASATLVLVPAAAHARAARVELSTALLAEDLFHGHAFTESIRSDATDPIRFTLQIRNLSASPTANLDLLLICPGYRTCDGAPIIAGFVQDGRRWTRPVLGARVNITPYSAFGKFSIGLVEASDSSSKLRTMFDPPYSAYVLLPKDYALAAVFPLGVLPPRDVATIVMRGTFATPTGSGLGGGPVIVVKPASGGKYDSAGVAAPGDQLTFSIRLNNTGFQPMQVHLRVGIAPRHPSDMVTVAAIVPGSSYPGGILGTATVRSEIGRPISLSVVSGTTEYFATRSACSKQQVLMHLADGIETHGLLVGAVGGFVPFDPCHGSEFTRFVNFEAMVH